MRIFNHALNAPLAWLLLGLMLSGVASAQQSDNLVEPTAALPTDEFGKQATWSAPKEADVRDQTFKWLDERKVSDQIRRQAEALWPANEPPVIGQSEFDAQRTLERLALTIALVEPEVKKLVAMCSQPRDNQPHPEFAILADEKQSAFVRNNLRLYYGRWLGQERFYDESMAQIAALAPADVIDPASLLFYQSVNYHWLLKKSDGLKAIGRLFEQRDQIPRRYATVAMLMQADLSMLKDDSLDHISRRMNDITRRLEFGRAGKKVQGVENGVIASLDKLIEELEKEKAGGGGGAGSGGGQQPGGSGPAQGIQSNAPAADSTPATGKGPGNNNKKNIGSKSGWGDLPAKEREEALQQIGKDFPSHYRDIIESYFRRIAESD